MTRARVFGLVALVALPLLPSAARPQRAEPNPFAHAHAEARLGISTAEPSGAEPLVPLGAVIARWAGVGKWVSLASTLGLGALGFVAHQRAEDRFDRLEEICTSDAPRCRSFNQDGSYADAELEALFQSVTDRDAAARAYFIGTQVTFAASVALFIIDLKEGGRPENIPYEPPEIRLGLEPGAVGLRWYAF